MSVPDSTFKTDSIANEFATEDTKSRYNIDQKSGFKVKPGTLIEEWDGILTRPESYDIKHPQLRIRVKAEELIGPKRPESNNVFLSVSVAAEDL